MGILLRVIGGLLVMGVGVIFIMQTEWFLQNIGRNEWAEMKIGGTRNLYKLLGIITIFFGLLIMTGMIGGFLLGTVGRLFTPPA